MLKERVDSIDHMKSYDVCKGEFYITNLVNVTVVKECRTSQHFDSGQAGGLERQKRKYELVEYPV